MKVRHRNTGRTITVSATQARVLRKTGWLPVDESDTVAPDLPVEHDVDTPTLDEPSTAQQPIHVGQGWYELPNGDKVRGREAADEAFAALNQG
jgi:hypothetical protein